MEEKISDIAGIDISIYNTSFVEKIINGRMSKTKCNSYDEYTIYLKINRNEINELKKALNNNYSEFFRNTLTFACLEHIILPTLIDGKSNSNLELRIWSAACAAGQEAYSIAILCDEFRECTRSNISCHIFATDINNDDLEYARKGAYQTATLNNVSLKRIQRFFVQKGETYNILPRLSTYVDFSVFDLLLEQGVCPPASIYGSFDLVFCCNLLFYYKPEYRQLILEKIDKNLAPGGFLITGETERKIVETVNYREVFTNSAIFQKR